MRIERLQELWRHDRVIHQEKPSLFREDVLRDPVTPDRHSRNKSTGANRCLI